MSRPAHIVAKKRWLEEHGTIAWKPFDDGHATGGTWTSFGRRNNAFVISINVKGSEAIVNTLYDTAKKHLSNICKCKDE